MSKPKIGETKGEITVLTARVAGTSSGLVPETILGHNLEVHTKTVQTFLSDRLENAKFAGPADPNGIAPPWRANSTHYLGCTLSLADVGLSGRESQELLSYQTGPSTRLLQTDRPVRAGEELEVELWARTRHEPTALSVALAKSERRLPEYDRADIVVNTTYWRRYTMRLRATADDDHALLTVVLSGRGRVWIDQIHLRRAGDGHLAADTMAAVASVRPPAMRFPGGCRAITYNWRDGIGPVHLRPSVYDSAYNLLRVNDFGTDEYVQMCVEQSVTPHLTLNLGSSTPDDAAQWVAYIAERYRFYNQEPPTAYVQIGNEDYLRQEFSNMTGDMYADALRDYVPRVREAYPAARIIANAPKTSRLVDGRDAPWRAPVVAAAKELGIEVLALHVYMTETAPDPQAQQQIVTAGIATLSERVQSLISDCRAAGLDCSVAVTEWNYLVTGDLWDGPTQLERTGPMTLEHYDARHCLYIAGAIQTFAKQAPDLELANFYQLVGNYGLIRKNGLDLQVSPGVDVFRLYREALPAHRHEVAIASDSAEGRGNELDAVALADDRDTTWVYMINQSPVEAAAVQIEGLVGVPSEIVTMSATEPTSEMRIVDAEVSANGILTVPALSITRVRYAHE